MDDRQGPGSTSEFARPDFSAPAPGAQTPDPASTAQFPRPDFGQPQDQGQGQSLGQGLGQGQPGPVRRDRGNEDFGAPRPPVAPQDPQYRPALPQQPQQPEALPPASGPGDGRTPLYDTLETNWFHGPQQNGQQQNGQQQGQQYGQQPNQPQPAAPQPSGFPQQQPAEERPAPQRGPGDTNGVTSSWRASPNDELGRQAERVKKPAAGGITTSGLPRRVPRANLVPGTAQQQNHQSGPQVSRAPDDVRGRLTNLRRGIQQGRQANNGQSTGSFPIGPTHQQER